MLVETKQFEVGAAVKHAAHGLGVIQKILGDDRAFVKFVAPTVEGDTEDVVLLEDLEPVEDLANSTPKASTTDQNVVPLPDFQKIAEAMVKLGGHVTWAPTGQKACILTGWQNQATRDLTVIQKWAEEDRHRNGVVVAKHDGLWILDLDDNGVLDEYERAHGPIKTYKVKSPSGGTHAYFLQDQNSIAMGNLSEKSADGEAWSARVLNRYVVAPGSVAHPNNDPQQPLAQYRAIDRSPIIAAPLTLIEFLKSRAGVSSVNNPASVVTNHAKVLKGGRNDYLTSRAGVLRQAGLEQEEMETVLLRENETDIEEPLGRDEVLTIALWNSRQDYSQTSTGDRITSGWQFARTSCVFREHCWPYVLLSGRR